MIKIGYMHPVDVGRHLEITTERLNDVQVPVWAGEPDAPTPEVEPVAWIFEWDQPSGTLPPNIVTFKRLDPAYGWAKETPLYTHAAPTPEVELFHKPASEGDMAIYQSIADNYHRDANMSELVKAAELVVASHDAHVAYSPTSYGLLSAIENLRDALSKQQPAKAEPKAPPTQDEMYAMELAMNRHLNGGGS